MPGRAWKWLGVLALLGAGCANHPPDYHPPDLKEARPPGSNAGQVMTPVPTDAGTASSWPLCREFDASGALFCSHGGPAQRERRVIRDEATWAAVWQELMDHESPVPPVPPVDFDREMVVLAGMGTRNSGGHAIRVVQVTQGAEALEVTVRESAPGPDCMVLTVMTEPFTAVRVPRTDAEVRFIEQEETRNCGP